MLFLLGEVRTRRFLELGCCVGLGIRREWSRIGWAGTAVMKVRRKKGIRAGRMGGGGNELTRRVVALRRMPTMVEGDAVPEAALSAAYTSDRTD